MSDAMNPSQSLPDDSAQSSASPDPVKIGSSHSETEENDWQTVSFPGALNVDAIPVDGTNQQSTGLESANLFDQDGRSTHPNNTNVIHQLQQENEALRVQIAHLEEDLSQAQIELQLEMARFYCKEADAEVVMTDQNSDAIALAQAQIQELSEALRTTQQTLEQQQTILEQQKSTIEQHQTTIATLTNQLDCSQQRIAQLERDCALSQQRYNEQLQLVSQVENTCQDLRMRLHRQQQQTLQFKAALEKSIEMNAVLDASHVEPTSISDNSPHPTQEEAPTSFIPKARPVQPWSTNPRVASQLHPHTKPGNGLPSLLAKLAKQPLPPESPSDTEAIVDVAAVAPFEPTIPSENSPQTLPFDEASKNILEFLFPAQPSVPTVNEPLPPAAVFDLSPFIEAGEVDSDSISSTKDESVPAETIVHQPKPEQPTHNSAPRSQAAELWADLARLIEPDLTETESVGSGVNESLPIDTKVVAMQPNGEDTPASSGDTSNSSPKPISLVSFVISDSTQALPTEEESSIAAQNPFPSFTLYSNESVGSNEIAAESEMAIAPPSDTSVSTNSPSPILYPMRQPKKIPSMAAVDLPSFPRG